jgi:hypothetical protein
MGGRRLAEGQDITIDGSDPEAVVVMGRGMGPGE